MNFPARQVTKRYAFLATLLVLTCITIWAKAFIIITAEKDYWMKVSSRLKKENIEVPPTRGNILADNGEVLAASLPEYKLYMDYMSWEKDPKRRDKEQEKRDSLLHDKADSIAQGMHAIFPDIDPTAFKARLLEGRKKESHHWLLYDKRVSYIQYRQAKALPIFRLSAGAGGFHTEEFKTRKNPYGRLAIRTIGDLFKGKDEARTGLELSFDSILRGKPGIAHRQKVFNRYLTIIDKPAENGYDVQTTINIGMQDLCEQVLSRKLASVEANSGVVILMEVATGDIKAMTSLRRLEDGSYQEVNADAVKNLYEPGSVFKPMSFLVAFDDGYLHMTDQVDVGSGIKEMYGRKMRDANWRNGGSGVVTVPQILQKSLNVGVSTLIDRFYHNDPRKFVEGIYRIGVNEDLKIPIPGYARPRIRMPKADGSNWSKTALPWMSIGYETQIPPITTVNFYNGIANNGKMLRPRLVKAILKDGQPVKEYPVVVLREHMAKPEAVKNIQDCLESVVSVGTGKKARSPYFHVSGKTGTAQVWTRHGFTSQYLVSFAGYFPSEKPLYSCIVCVQRGGGASGSGDCAPVFKEVAEAVMAQRFSEDYSAARDTVHALLPRICAGNIAAAADLLDELGIKHQAPAGLQPGALVWGTTHTTANDVSLTANKPDKVQGNELTMPDVKGYGLRDAIFHLEKLGLKVSIRGVGRVSEQSIEAGSVVKRGTHVALTLGNPADLPLEEEADTAQTDRQPAAQQPAQPAASEQAAKPASEPTQKKSETPERQQATELKRKAETSNKKDQPKQRKQPLAAPKQRATEKAAKTTQKADGSAKKNKTKTTGKQGRTQQTN